MLQDGFGKLTHPDGRIYKGYWSKGKQHGRGKFQKDSKSDIIEGFWESGKFVSDININ